MVGLLGEQVNASIECLAEGFFLGCDKFLDVICLLGDFAEGLAHQLDNRRNQPRQEWFFYVEVLPAVASGTAEDSPQYITSAFIRWDYPVADCEGEGANMICDHPAGYVAEIFFTCYVEAIFEA